MRRATVRVASTMRVRNQFRILQPRVFAPESLPYRREFTASASGILLHYEWVGTQEDSPIVFLHGLLGNGRNVSTMARKICDAQKRPGLLIDIRGHGRSKGRNDPHTQTTFADCTLDIQKTILDAGVDESSRITLMGHSLGGRLSMEYAAAGLHPRPMHLWLLDTVPAILDTSVMHVLKVAKAIVNGKRAYRKSELTNELVEKHKLDRLTAQWLATSYKDGEFGFDIKVAYELVDDFVNQPFMKMIQNAVAEGDFRIDMVRAGKNKGWEESGMLPTLQQLECNHFQMHLLPKSGHWVHVEDLKGLLEAVTSVKAP